MASQRHQQYPRSCSLDSCAPKTRMVVNGENLMKAAAYPPAIVIAVLFRYCCAYTKQISRLSRSDCIKTHRRCRALCSYRSRTRHQRQKNGSNRKFHEHARGAGPKPKTGTVRCLRQGKGGARETKEDQHQHSRCQKPMPAALVPQRQKTSLPPAATGCMQSVARRRSC